MNVVTSLLGLIIVSHLSPKGSRRFKALRHSAWLDGVRAFVALGVWSLPEFGVVDLFSW
jgi:hypothetical protein